MTEVGTEERGKRIRMQEREGMQAPSEKGCRVGKGGGCTEWTEDDARVGRVQGR